MENARIVLDYVDVLAWPAVVAAALFGFRRTIKQLLARIVHVNAAGVTASFEKISKQAEQLTSPSGRSARSTTSKADLSGATRIVPSSYEEARTIGERFRAGQPVLLDLGHLPDREAKRLVDFAAGLVFHARGTIDRVTNKLFLLTPGG